MSSPRVTTVLLPPAKGRSIGGDGVDPPHGKCTWGEAGTTKLGKIRRPQLGRIQRPLTLRYRNLADSSRNVPGNKKCPISRCFRSVGKVSMA